MLKLSQPTRLLLIAAAVCLAACSSNPKKNVVKTEKDYYLTAQKSMTKGNFSTATDELEQLESHYPVGQYTEQAQLELIYAKYRHLDYPGASAAADRFIRLHPAHPQLDYAYYMRGLADYDASSDTFNRYLPMDPSHRDVSGARDAFNGFRDLLNRFPNSPYAHDARQRMIFLRNEFAESEMHVARYYVRRGAWVAALARARWVVENYQGAPVVPEALATEIYCYDKLGMATQAQSHMQLLKTNFPNDPHIDKLGQVQVDVGPQNERRSWLNVVTFGLLGSDNVVGQE